MTQFECIQAIAKKHYEIRIANDLPGDEGRDWRFANIVYRFFADYAAPRTEEWKQKASDYEPYEEIYEQSLWVP